MNVRFALVFTVTYLLPMALLLLFIIFPERPVSWVGRISRKVQKDYLKQSDETIDRFPLFPWEALTIGKRSRYVNRAGDHPDEFPRAILWVRVFACAMEGLWVLSLALLIWAAMTGRLTTVP